MTTRPTPTFHRALAAALLALGAAAEASAVPYLVVDDFGSGNQPRVARSSSTTPVLLQRTQEGSMLGDYRTITWQMAADTSIPDPIPGRQALFEVSGHRLVVENGMDISYRLDLDWGYDRQGDDNPLDIDLEPIREDGELTVHVHSADTVVVLNAILVTGDGADTFQASVNVEPLTTPQAVPLALSSFVSNVTSEPVGEGDLADVDHITIFFQSGGLGTDVALDGVEFSE